MQEGAVVLTDRGDVATNAVKYTPPGGRIRLALRADGSDAVLSVEDTGFGTESGRGETVRLKSDTT